MSNELKAKLVSENEIYQQKFKTLYSLLQSRHSHAEMSEWVNCFPCMQRYKEYKEMRSKMNLKESGKFLKWLNKNRAKSELLKKI